MLPRSFFILSRLATNPFAFILNAVGKLTERLEKLTACMLPIAVPEIVRERFGHCLINVDGILLMKCIKSGFPIFPFNDTLNFPGLSLAKVFKSNDTFARRYECGVLK